MEECKRKITLHLDPLDRELFETKLEQFGLRKSEALVGIIHLINASDSYLLSILEKISEEKFKSKTIEFDDKDLYEKIKQKIANK